MDLGRYNVKLQHIAVTFHWMRCGSKTEFTRACDSIWQDTRTHSLNLSKIPGTTTDLRVRYPRKPSVDGTTQGIIKINCLKIRFKMTQDSIYKHILSYLEIGAVGLMWCHYKAWRNIRNLVWHRISLNEMKCPHTTRYWCICLMVSPFSATITPDQRSRMGKQNHDPNTDLSPHFLLFHDGSRNMAYFMILFLG